MDSPTQRARSEPGALPESGALQFRFPYPPGLKLGLIAVVVLSFAQSVYIYQTVATLVRDFGAGTEDPWRYVMFMFGLTVVLCVFVSGALLYRARLRLTADERAIVLTRLHPSTSKRRMQLALDQIDRVVVDVDTRRRWRASIDAGRDTIVVPLTYSVDLEGRRYRVGSAAQAGAHPLVAFLKARLEERMEISG